MYSGFRNRRTDLGTIVQRQVGRLALRYVDGGAYVRTYVQAVCDRVLTQRREGVRIRMEFLITTATSTITTTIATTYQYDYECHYDQQATRTTTTIHYEYDDYHPLLHTFFYGHYVRTIATTTSKRYASVVDTCFARTINRENKRTAMVPLAHMSGDIFIFVLHDCVSCEEVT